MGRRRILLNYAFLDTIGLRHKLWMTQATFAMTQPTFAMPSQNVKVGGAPHQMGSEIFGAPFRFLTQRPPAPQLRRRLPFRPLSRNAQTLLVRGHAPQVLHFGLQFLHQGFRRLRLRRQLVFQGLCFDLEIVDLRL